MLDPRIAALVRRVSVVVDPGNRNNHAPVRLKVTTLDGNVIEHEAKTYRGSAELPLTDVDLEEKLAMCIDAAGARDAHAKAGAACEAIMNVDETSNVTAFVSTLLASCRD